MKLPKMKSLSLVLPWLVAAISSFALAAEPGQPPSSLEEWRIRELVPSEAPVETQNKLAFHGLFTDGMILQRDQEVPVWGWGPDGETVEVRFGDTKVQTTVKGNSWMVKLPPMQASDQGRELTVRCGPHQVVLKDVLVGEVWLCSGQSNMMVEMKLDVDKDPQRAADIKSANNPLIRFFKVDRASAREPRRDIPSVRDDIYAPWSNAFLGNQWRPCTKEWVPHVGATPFYFARALQEKVKCPVGMLICARGGSSIDCWVPASVICGEPCWSDRKDALAFAQDRWPEFIRPLIEKMRPFQEKFPTLHDLWLAQNAAPNNKPVPFPQPAWPTCFYNAMLHPMAPFAFRGILWYQGEGDAGGAGVYADKMASLIRSWRSLWSKPDMPFVFAQLAGFAGVKAEPPDADLHNWAALRAAQSRVPGTVPGAFMACLIDAGMQHNIHPVRKDVAGGRLAGVALREVYKNNIPANGPQFLSLSRSDGNLRVRFRNTEKGLEAREVEMDGIRLSSERLVGFEICGADRKFFKAEAKIEGEEVVVFNPEVPNPVAVRYAWADFPLANLYNRDALPAEPFEAELPLK